MDSTKIDRAHRMHYVIRRGYCAMQRGHIAVMAGIALVTAFVARFGPHLPPGQMRNLMIVLPVAMLIHAGLSCYNRTFALSWACFSMGDVLALARVVEGAAFKL